MELSQEISKKIEYWSSSPDFDMNTRKEISSLLEAGESKELIERFYRDLEFGTGGMRGILGAGTFRMNIFNIRKATFALANYLSEHFASKDIRVALTFDSRNFSKEFAQGAAEVLAATGIKVFITKDMRPVPMLSFMVRYFQCQAGICITASHNPPEYNGFKVYWQTGGQLVPPHDQGIFHLYQNISTYGSIPKTEYAQALENKIIEEIDTTFDKIYTDKIKEIPLLHGTKDDTSIVYSPLHGTGITLIPKTLESLGFSNLHIVEEQSLPDGNFPTVSSPNPEEPEALAMALSLAQEKNADMVIATDPDTDRIGLMVNENGEWVRFNGNQLGCLLTEYVLHSYKKLSLLPKNPLVIKTIVTTDLQARIAEYYGATCQETLTGFKWICQLIEKYETGELKPYHQFICGGEESYGFLASSFVRDKDAVISCVIAAEMVSYYKSQGKNLTQVLDEIYLLHGTHADSLYTMTLPGKDGAESIGKIMDHLRNSAPKNILDFPVTEILDIQTGERKILQENSHAKIFKIDLPSSNVLQFVLTDRAKISIRPSGTEPKIKIYTSFKLNSSSVSDLPNDKKYANQQVKNIEENFIEIVSKLL